MSCRRCRGPDSGTTDLCDRCESQVEQEQSLEDELETGRPWAEGHPHCWFAEVFADAGPCEGRLVKCHLIKRQVLVREGLDWFVADPRSWVWGCGGVMGNAGHHGKYKPDGSRPVPRGLLPAGFVRLCGDLSLGWYLDRTFGLLDESEAA